MTLARLILMNALTRSNEYQCHGAATFADPNCIVVACKQQRAITRCCTSA